MVLKAPYGKENAFGFAAPSIAKQLGWSAKNLGWKPTLGCFGEGCLWLYCLLVHWNQHSLCCRGHQCLMQSGQESSHARLSLLSSDLRLTLLIVIDEDATRLRCSMAVTRWSLSLAIPDDGG